MLIARDTGSGVGKPGARRGLIQAPHVVKGRSLTELIRRSLVLAAHKVRDENGRPRAHRHLRRAPEIIHCLAELQVRRANSGIESRKYGLGRGIAPRGVVQHCCHILDREALLEAHRRTLVGDEAVARRHGRGEELGRMPAPRPSYVYDLAADGFEDRSDCVDRTQITAAQDGARSIEVIPRLAMYGRVDQLYPTPEKV